MCCDDVLCCTQVALVSFFFLFLFVLAFPAQTRTHSLVTLAVQNAALAIVMHYSRIITPPELAYSPASAVLINELLKGAISFTMALYTARSSPLASPSTVCADIFSPDAWKLSIPALLYVVQNSLQFVAISNLPVATFQVTYQMKILTTAAFSVVLLRKKLDPTKWLSLLFLAIGVAIVHYHQSFTQGPACRKRS